MNYGLLIASIFVFLVLSVILAEKTKKYRFNRWSDKKLQQKYTEAYKETKDYEVESSHSLDSYWEDRTSDMEIMEQIATERGIVLN